MSWLDENLKALEGCQPSMAEALRGQESSKHIELAPIQESVPDADAIVVTGLPSVDSWPKLLSGKTAYVIVAHDALPELKAYLTVMDLRKPLQDQRVCFAVGEEGVLQLLNDLFGTLYRRNVVLFGHTEMPSYTLAKKEMHFFDTLCAANRATLDQFAEEWQNNVSDNFKDFLQGPFLQEEAGRWRGSEAVVVAAGPSLDQLAGPDIFDGAAVVACDTAVPVLVSRGVTPDIIFTLDSSESNRAYLRDLPAEVYEKSVLCVTPVVARQVYESFRRVLFYSYGHPTLDHLRDHGLPFAPLASGGSVALTAVDAVRHFGAKRVYLLGCDFQYLPHRTHARGTGAAYRAIGTVSRWRTFEQVHYDSEKNSCPDPMQVEWSKDQMMTDRKLKKWRDWLELYVKNHDLKILQMSRQSAPIPGVEFGLPGGAGRGAPELMCRPREVSPSIRREIKFLMKELEMAMTAPPPELKMRVQALPRVSKCFGYILAWLSGMPADEASWALSRVLARFHSGVQAVSQGR